MIYHDIVLHSFFCVAFNYLVEWFDMNSDMSLFAVFAS